MNFEIKDRQQPTHEDRKKYWLWTVERKAANYRFIPLEFKEDVDIAWAAVQKDPSLINQMGPSLTRRCESDDPIKTLERLATHKQLQEKLAVKQETQPTRGMKL